MIGLKSGSRIRSFLTGSSRLRSGRYIISSGSNVRSDTSSAYGQQARYIHDGNHIGQKTGDGPEAEKVLRGQDPRGRIRFLKQLLRPDQALSKIKAAFPDVVSIELHAIPFWLVHFCFYLGYDWGRYIGFIPLSANNGFSVSAVHEDHWCSGVILGDDLDVMMQRMRQSRRNGPTALSHDLDYSFASPDGDWDPTVAPLFHYSYPAIDDFAGKAGGSQFEEEQQLQASLGPHKTWAFPYYRKLHV
ncbi:hypothetical protein BCR39DRAFT_196995 [Naematelia encephala]|uniref:Uncharacterized protein n=1 Tax=Naematelia encephala TaxID=71784 RepID=A0A1Y2BHT2_9TREE|nr:hypothetical protein BCR39DRAFT_196995 [Naematelia encephala]